MGAGLRFAKAKAAEVHDLREEIIKGYETGEYLATARIAQASPEFLLPVRPKDKGVQREADVEGL